MIVRARENEEVEIVRIPEWSEAKADIETKLRKCIEDNTSPDITGDGEYGYKVYIDSRYDVFSNDTLVKFSKMRTELGDGTCDHIRELCTLEWETEEKWRIEDDVMDEFENAYPVEFNDYEEEIKELLREWIYAYVSEDDVNQPIDVAITLDVGDLNYDFDKNNVFNSWSNSSELDPLSPVRWLAKTQRKLTELEKAIKEVNDGEYKEENHGQFVNSCISELANQYNCMSCMTFLVKMGLNDYVKLQGMIHRQRELNKTVKDAEYYYDERIDNGEYIALEKNVECGLFNPWLGSGSVLEIALEKDIKIPMKAIWSAWIEVHGGCPYGYTVDEVYGLDRRVFREVIELHGKHPWE